MQICRKEQEDSFMGYRCNIKLYSGCLSSKYIRPYAPDYYLISLRMDMETLLIAYSMSSD